MAWMLQESVQGTRTKEVFAQEQTIPQYNEITLPVTIPGTTLLAEQLSAYEGPFLEDGAGQEGVDIAALHIYNAGEQEVQNACITLQMDIGNYVFYGEHIPSGATVVLLEMRASPYQKSIIKNCTGWQATSDKAQQDGVLITDKDNGTLIVTNITNNTLKNLRLYYKSWLSPPGVYMGGITYSVTIEQLLPGQTEMLCPDRYATGYSKVVSVVTEP